MGFLDTMITIQGDIVLFGDSKLSQSPEYGKVVEEVFALRQRLLMRGGRKIEELLDEYTEVVESQQDYIAEDYFEQGYLAAQRQKQKRQKKKEPS